MLQDPQITHTYTHTKLGMFEISLWVWVGIGLRLFWLCGTHRPLIETLARVEFRGGEIIRCR